jgi:two-component sensor histidine kinase
MTDMQGGSLFEIDDLADTDWQALAPAAGGIGRYVMDFETGRAEIDGTFRRITGLATFTAPFPAEDFLQHVHDDDRAAVTAAIEASRREGARYDEVYRFLRPDNGEVCWLSAHGRPVMMSNGRTFLIGAVYDVTALRAAQDRAELLAGEMAHRIRNVFTLTQSMFNMAARSSETKDDLVESFTSRLRALMAVNTLTFATEDRRVVLGDLTTSLLGPLIAMGRIRAEVTEDFALSGAAAQTLTLALNELMTNATKHGALKDATGVIDLSMSVADDVFTLRWHETTGHEVSEPQGRGGFGMRVLGGMTRATYEGAPRFEWRPDGLTFTCTWGVRGFGFEAGTGYAAPVADSAVAAART